MDELVFRSDVKVELNYSVGSDLTVCRSAWVSSGKDDLEPSESRMKGLINALIRSKHGTPFESAFLEFRVEAPRAVRDEACRHRNLSFSSSSLRYTVSAPVVYIPPARRPLKKAEGFKQIQPVYEALDPKDYVRYTNILKQGYIQTYDALVYMQEQGFGETEQLRWLTQDGLYVTFIVRGMLRQMLQFLALRTQSEHANHPSYPMFEINEMADQMETVIAEQFPIVYAAWNRHGREI